jgi:hypothetical protein
MLKPAILALIRQILTVAGTALVAKGYVQASDIEPVIGALLTIGSVVWSVADKRVRRLQFSRRDRRLSSPWALAAQGGLRTAHPISCRAEQSSVYLRQHRRGSSKLATAVPSLGLRVDRVAPAPSGSP